MNACFACSRRFPANDELEWLPQGRMFAFDTGRGRLWVICGWCSQWSLMPIEQRWEAVEELERLTSSGRVLGATGEVSLIQIGRVRAVRVGRAQLQEEAWWRFGTSLRGRQRRYAIVSSIGGALSAGAAVTGLLAMAAVPGMIEIAALRRFRVTKVPDVARKRGGEYAGAFDRRFRYGRIAWNGTAACADCGTVLRRLTYGQRYGAVVRPGGDISVQCQRCRRREPGHVIAGAEASDLLRRCLSYTNIAGATTTQLEQAIELVRTGMVTPRSYTGPLSLPTLGREELIALELAATERCEAQALEWEIRDLEARWRSAEVLAAIVDRELS